MEEKVENKGYTLVRYSLADLWSTKKKKKVGKKLGMLDEKKEGGCCLS